MHKQNAIHVTLLILGLTLWSSTSGAEKKVRLTSLHLGIAAYQSGSPLAIVNMSATNAFPFQKVSLQNTSDKMVSSVT